MLPFLVYSKQMVPLSFTLAPMRYCTFSSVVFAEKHDANLNCICSSHIIFINEQCHHENHT